MSIFKFPGAYHIAMGSIFFVVCHIALMSIFKFSGAYHIVMRSILFCCMSHNPDVNIQVFGCISDST